MKLTSPGDPKLISYDNVLPSKTTIDAMTSGLIYPNEKFLIKGFNFIYFFIEMPVQLFEHFFKIRVSLTCKNLQKMLKN